MFGMFRMFCMFGMFRMFGMFDMWQFTFCSLPEHDAFNFFYASKDHAFYIMNISHMHTLKKYGQTYSEIKKQKYKELKNFNALFYWLKSICKKINGF